jgi:hypothetical protein
MEVVFNLNKGYNRGTACCNLSKKKLLFVSVLDKLLLICYMATNVTFVSVYKIEDFCMQDKCAVLWEKGTFWAEQVAV